MRLLNDNNNNSSNNKISNINRKLDKAAVITLDLKLRKLEDEKRRRKAKEIEEGKTETAAHRRLVCLLGTYLIIKRKPLEHPSSWESDGKGGGGGCSELHGCTSDCKFRFPLSKEDHLDDLEYYMQTVLDYQKWRAEIGRPLTINYY